MIIAPRLLSGIFRCGLLIAACSVWCLPAFGRDVTPSNPLRRPQERPVKALARVAKPEKSTEVKAAADTELEATAPREVKFTAKPMPRPATSQVRAAGFGLQAPIRQPLGYGPPPAASFETKVVGPAVPALSAERGALKGEVIYDEGFADVHGGVIYGGEGMDCCGGAGCYQCCMIPCPVISLKDTEAFVGVHGNTGPRNRGESGSFGFHEGFNWGTPFPCTYGALGAQVGMRAAQSSLSGTDFTDSTRTQIFLTGGLFRRVDWGLQGGVVLDYLSEDWYSSIDILQIRSEASWVFPCSHEFGFWFTASTNFDTKTSVFSGSMASAVETWEATDLYAFFYRRRFECHPGAEARVFAGFTGVSDGLIGADARLPIGMNWALQTDFAYLVPREGTGTAGGGHREEGWNVGISLVWYPGCQGFGECDYYRPLLNVAGNGSFMLDQR